MHRVSVVTVCAGTRSHRPDRRLDVDRLMIRIRYAELPAGLHVVAEADRRGTVVYLLPGLTPAQRRTALVRARRSARMGQGPGLPAVPMAGAVVTDRVRTNMRNASAAMWRHPMLFLPPVVLLVSSTIVFALMSFAPLPAAQYGTAQAGAAQLNISAGQSAAPRHHPSPPVGAPALSVGPKPSAAPSGHATRTSRRHHARRHQRMALPALWAGPPVPAGSPSPAPTEAGSAGGMCHTFDSGALCMRG